MPGFQFINSGGAPGASVGVGISTIVGPTGPAGGVSFDTPINSSFVSAVTTGMTFRTNGSLGFVCTKGETLAAGNINLPDSQDKFVTVGSANTGGDFAGAYNYTGTYIQWGSTGKILIGLAMGKMMEDRLGVSFAAPGIPLSAFTANTTVGSLIPEVTGTAVVLTNVDSSTSVRPNLWTGASTGSFNLSTLTVGELMQYNFGSFAIPIGSQAIFDTYHPTFGYALGDALGGVSNMIAQGRAADVYIDNADLYYSSRSLDFMSTGSRSNITPNPGPDNAIQQALGWAIWSDNLTGAGYYNAASGVANGLYMDNIRVINNAKAATGSSTYTGLFAQSSGAYVPLSFSSRGGNANSFFTTGASRNPYGINMPSYRYNFYTFNLLAQALDNLAKRNGFTGLIQYIRNKILTPLGMTKTYFSIGEDGPADIDANKAQLAWSRSNLEIYMQTGLFSSISNQAATGSDVTTSGIQLGISPWNYGCSTGYNDAWTNAYTLSTTQVGNLGPLLGFQQLKVMLGPLVWSSQYPDDGNSRLYDALTSRYAQFPNQVFGESPVYSTMADWVKLIKCIMKYGKHNNTQVLSPQLIEWFLTAKTPSLTNITSVGGATDDGTRNSWCGGILKRNVEADNDANFRTSDDSYNAPGVFGSDVLLNMKTGYWAIIYYNRSGLSAQSIPVPFQLPTNFDYSFVTLPQLTDLN
jgi:hypothetical protein